MMLNKLVISSAAAFAIALSGAVFAETAADKTLDAAKAAEKAAAATAVTDQKKADAAMADMAKHPKDAAKAEAAEKAELGAAKAQGDLAKDIHDKTEAATNAVLKDEAKPIGGY